MGSAIMHIAGTHRMTEAAFAGISFAVMLLGAHASAQIAPEPTGAARHPIGPDLPEPPPPPRYTAPRPGQPAEIQPPGATDQVPAFPEQTRAPYVRSNVAFTIETVTEGLEYPGGMAFLPDGRILVTERAGRLRIVSGSEIS